MLDQERACTMRADGVSVTEISKKLGISKQWAYKVAANIIPGSSRPSETATSVVRHVAVNGGCSSLSGLTAISLPRIPSLHGALQTAGAA